MLSLSDMLSLAISGSGVELYRKGKFRGKLFIPQCELEQPVDMVCRDGKQGSVSSYPPRKQLDTSASLPAYPTYPHHPPDNTILRYSKIPPNNQTPYQPSTDTPADNWSVEVGIGSLPRQALQAYYPPPPVRTISNPERMVQRKPNSNLHDRVLRKVSQGASMMGLGSVEESLETIGKMRKDSLGSLRDQLGRLAKK